MMKVLKCIWRKFDEPVDNDPFMVMLCFAVAAIVGTFLVRGIFILSAWIDGPH